MSPNALIEKIYAVILPMMIKDGIEDTPINRLGCLIKIRVDALNGHGPQNAWERYLLIEALTEEINRLSKELGIDEEPISS